MKRWNELGKKMDEFCSKGLEDLANEYGYKDAYEMKHSKNQNHLSLYHKTHENLIKRFVRDNQYKIDNL